MTRAAFRRLLVAFLLLAAPVVTPAESLRVAIDPARPRPGDVVLLTVRGAAPEATVEITVDGKPVTGFGGADGQSAVIGLDMDAPSTPVPWQVAATSANGTARASGRIPVAARTYTVQRLTVAPGMAVLDPETERRAEEETARLRATYRMISGERLWRGRFVRPVAGEEPGTGFGARRIINGHPRAPHSGIDFAAPVGTAIIAANRGRVALVGEFFFPGRLVILDHGLGLHTAYFHLDSIGVSEGQVVARGERLGTVGMTGRVTGPHLHFGAQIGAARIDPAALLGLAALDERD